MSRVSFSVFLSILAVLVAPSYGQNQTQTQTQQWSTYEHKLAGFSIQHPENWEPIANSSSVSFEVYENETRPLVFASVVSIPKVVLPDIATEELMKAATYMTIGDDISEIYEFDNNATINGIPASKIVAMTTNEEGEDSDRFIAYFINGKDVFYSVHFITRPTNYERFVPTIQKMVDSFEIKPGL